MKHTPEPWYIDINQHAGIHSSSIVIRTCSEGDNGESKDLMIIGLGDVCGNENDYPKLTDYNAARIVACVNACAGIDSEYLKKGKLAEQIANANAANYYKDLLLRFFSAYKNARNARPDGNSAEQFNLRQRIAEIEAAIMEGYL